MVGIEPGRIMRVLEQMVFGMWRRGTTMIAEMHEDGSGYYEASEKTGKDLVGGGKPL